MSAARWERLTVSLADAGVRVTVDALPYSEDHYGRVRHGVTRRITIRLSDGSLVQIHDKWWRKNDDVWIGWQVHIDQPDGIVGRTWPITKKRGEVVAAVRQAIGSEVSR